MTADRLHFSQDFTRTAAALARRDAVLDAWFVADPAERKSTTAIATELNLDEAAVCAIIASAMRAKRGRR